MGSLSQRSRSCHLGICVIILGRLICKGEGVGTGRSGGLFTVTMGTVRAPWAEPLRGGVRNAGAGECLPAVLTVPGRPPLGFSAQARPCALASQNQPAWEEARPWGPWIWGFTLSSDVVTVASHRLRAAAISLESMRHFPILHGKVSRPGRETEAGAGRRRLVAE